ncbi:MAG: ral nucleoside transport system permease protein [Clostridiales bacterium]|nr:ral nucleoside transport system permease protein [Clostridiales bacterium]
MKNKKSLKDYNIVFTLFSILVGFAFGALMLLIAKISPVEAYKTLFEGIFSKPKYMVWSIVYATPLIFTGLSVAFSFRTGVFNIGAEGQFVVGTLAACAVGILVKLPATLHIILCFTAAVVAGAIWGVIVAYLKVKWGINEVLSMIMFNWIAFYLSNYVMNFAILHKEGGGEATKDIMDSAKITLPFLDAKTFGPNANWGIVVAILVALLIYFIINKTTLGYRLRAVGYNLHAAEYGGISANRAVMTAMAISGGLAGLGGAMQLMGMSMRISQFSAQEGYGFDGITVALIGGSNPIGCIFAGLFYGAMKYGGSKLNLIGAPSEIIKIIMGCIVFFIAISHVFKAIVAKGSAKKEAK